MVFPDNATHATSKCTAGQGSRQAQRSAVNRAGQGRVCLEGRGHVDLPERHPPGRFPGCAQGNMLIQLRKKSLVLGHSILLCLALRLTIVYLTKASLPFTVLFQEVGFDGY
jgi:hypothetical protein